MPAGACRRLAQEIDEVRSVVIARDSGEHITTGREHDEIGIGRFAKLGQPLLVILGQFSALLGGDRGDRDKIGV